MIGMKTALWSWAGLAAFALMGTAWCIHKMVRLACSRGTVHSLQWLQKWTQTQQGRISIEELDDSEKRFERLQENLKVKLEKQERGELVQLLLVCSYYGFSKVFAQVMAVLERRIKIEEDGNDNRPALPEDGRKSWSSQQSYNNALFIAARQGQVDIVQFLLSHAIVDLNARNSHGNSALILASTGGHVQVVKLLVGLPTDPNVTNRFRESALDYACDRGFYEIVDLLMNRTDIDPSLNNYQAIRKAVQKNHDRILLMMLQRSRLAIVPCRGIHLHEKMIRYLQDAAVEAAHICAGIMNSEWLACLPPHLRAYVLFMAYGNSVVLLGPSRAQLWKVSKVILDVEMTNAMK